MAHEEAELKIYETPEVSRLGHVRRVTQNVLNFGTGDTEWRVVTNDGSELELEGPS